MRIRLYPRPRDQQIVYLKDVIESPRVHLSISLQKVLRMIIWDRLL